MAGMTTVLTEFSSIGNSRTSTYGAHEATKPMLVIEKRRVPEGNQTVIEYSAKVVTYAKDVDNVVVSGKVSFEFLARYPLEARTNEKDAALVIFRDLIAGDELTNSVDTQEWL